MSNLRSVTHQAEGRCTGCPQGAPAGALPRHPAGEPSSRLIVTVCTLVLLGALSPHVVRAGVQATFLDQMHAGERPVPRSVLVLAPLTSARLWSDDGSTRGLPSSAEELAEHLHVLMAGELGARGFQAQRAVATPFDVRAAIEEAIRRREPRADRISLYSPRNDLLRAGRYRLGREHTADLQRAGAEAILYVEAHAEELSDGATAVARDESRDWNGPLGSHCVLHWWLVETRGGLLVGHGQARRAGWVSEESKELAARVTHEALTPMEAFKSRLPTPKR